MNTCSDGADVGGNGNAFHMRGDAVVAVGVVVVVVVEAAAAAVV